MSWASVKLSEICDLQNGYAFKSKDYIDSSNTMSCRMSNIRPGGKFEIDYNPRFLPDNFEEKYGQYVLNDGDVVIAMTDLAGSPKILGVPTIVQTNGRVILLNQRVGKLIIKDEQKVYFGYLKFALSEPRIRKYYQKFAGGGLQINLGKDDLLSVEIPLPSLPVQKQIAAILEKADTLRGQCQQMEQELNSLAQSVFLDMFGDPVKNPNNFPIANLKDCYVEGKEATKCGPFGSALKKNEFVDEGIPVWNMDNITRTGKLVDNPRLWITRNKFNDLLQYSVNKGDVIISRAGTVGKMCVIDSKYEQSIISTNLIRLRLDPNKLLPQFFISLMLFCKGRVGRLKTGDDGSFSHMNTGILDKLFFPHPPLELQQTYIAKLCQINKIKDSLKIQQIEQSDNFNSLMQRAFKDELELKDMV